MDHRKELFFGVNGLVLLGNRRIISLTDGLSRNSGIICGQHMPISKIGSFGAEHEMNDFPRISQLEHIILYVLYKFLLHWQFLMSIRAGVVLHDYRRTMAW